MSTEEPSSKRPSKNAKSCAECRRRKVRCDWPAPGALRCAYCEDRGLFCEPQRPRTPGPEVVRITTRARLANLERSQSSIWAAVRQLQAQSGIAASAERPPSPSHASHVDEGPDCDEESDATESLSPPNAPIHLLQLFDNGVLDSGGNESGHGHTAASHHPPSPQRVQDCAALRALTPARTDMITIAAYASSWLPLYASLLPMVHVHNTPEALLARYDELQHEVDPIALATLLLYIAMAVQHAPSTASFPESENMQHLPTFVKTVSDTVERMVISDDALGGTLEGIEAALLFLRLQLGRVKVTKMWLLTRRVIALSELLGLPRATATLASMPNSVDSPSSDPDVARLKRRAQAWVSVCAIDRFASMLWSLPLATARYPLPKEPLLDCSTGQVNAQSYLYSLADIASRVSELDGMISARKPPSELFNAVMQTDHELRSLASFPGNEWWKPSNEFSIDVVLQYWHQYYSIRIHLQLALTYDGQSEQFAFNFITCLNACQELASRYLLLRPAAPAGFFANWVIDMQAFTSAVFLQLASYRITHKSGPGGFPHGFDVGVITSLVGQVVNAMGSSPGTSGNGFAQQAASAIQSLGSLLQRPNMQDPQRISLRLPLIGNIQISKRSYAKPDYASGQNVAPQNVLYTRPQSAENEMAFLDTNSDITSQQAPYTSDAMDMMDSFSYSIEIPETYYWEIPEPY
ncbi:hypothetical protein M409DRAFT_30909 [Zasmidium cellare ATCC 36951]|uniref:Zn(2)-C6 fungal-type domain-containing protein n=1 Tax=Zasmidium cellare ATCC 36951 TaxID=1080233 RepID=A0A6A6BYE0_ZASCE|nr:uncharacterized protein M409DRAFT_30909 [Zasmidium cellare ATCC 36951]KAF2158582.1 hypothetical protein M409DRAFT_30909 [Zasmidium cellare ATCC 36951]